MGSILSREKKSYISNNASNAMDTRVDDTAYKSTFCGYDVNSSGTDFNCNIQHVVANPRQRRDLYQPFVIKTKFSLCCIRSGDSVQIKLDAKFYPAFVSLSPLTDFFEVLKGYADYEACLSGIDAMCFQSFSFDWVTVNQDQLEALIALLRDHSSPQVAAGKFIPQERLQELEILLLGVTSSPSNAMMAD